MATQRSNLSSVRLLLGEPNPHAPSDPILFQLLSNQVQHHLNQLQNGSGHWSVDTYTLTVNPGQEDYLVSGQNFGKPFLVYTADESNPSHVRREVPFVLLQNAGQFYAGPQQIQASDSHTVQYFTFYRRNGAWWARATPIPGESKPYVVWFESGLAPDGLDDESGLSPFNHLIRVQTAIAAPPHSAWTGAYFNGTDREAAAWTRKTNALAMSLKQDEAKFQKEFSTYLGTLMQAGVESREGFGAEAECGWWGW